MIGGNEVSNLDLGKSIHLDQLQKFLQTCSSQSLIKNYKQIVKYYIRLLQSSCSRKIITQIKNQMRLIQQFYQIFNCSLSVQLGEPIPETKQPSFIKQYNTNTFQAIFRDCTCAILNLGGGFLFLNGKQGKIVTPINQDHYKIKARCLELFEKYFGHNFKSEQIESADCHKIQPIEIIRNKSLIGCVVRISIRAPLMNHIYSYPILKPSCQTKFFYSVKNGNTTRFADGESLYQLSNQIGQLGRRQGNQNQEILYLSALMIGQPQIYLTNSQFNVIINDTLQHFKYSIQSLCSFCW